MKTSKRPGATASGRGRELALLRNGRRAGTHGRGNRPDRRNTRRRAIQEASQ
jgi:hypothetical protein